MKVLVPIKRVVDYNVKVHVKSDGSGVDLTHVKMSANPFDEIALEQAIHLKENGHANEIMAVSIGVAAATDVLRGALAMGADSALLIVVPNAHTTDIEPLSIAKILCRVVREHNIDVVLCGKQAIDSDMNAMGQMLAGLLGWGQATFASHINMAADNQSALVTREIDGGEQALKVGFPAVITADLRLCEPRYVSLPNMIKAKRMPIEHKDIQEYGIDLTPRLTVLTTDEPNVRQAGVRVQSVHELVDKLKNEAKVL